MKIGPKYISAPLYKKIIASLPVACVDVVVVSRGKFLLGKRKRKPAQGKWWLIGGRVIKGELLRAAALRHIKIETGFARGKIKGQLGDTKETIFTDSSRGPATHTINTVFLAEVPDQKLAAKDSEMTTLQWFSRIDKRWPKYVRDALQTAGFK